MKTFLLAFFTAVRFLTVLPISLYVEEDENCFCKASCHFALVGLLVGLCGCFIFLVLKVVLPLPLACCVTLLFLSGISGFLHLDGLADSADGFFSSRPREKILEIMRDSRIGAMGVVAIVFLLLFKFSALATVPERMIPYTIILMPLSGRAAIVLAMHVLPYARKEGGLGQLFYDGRGAGVLACVALTYVVSLFFVSWDLVLFSVVTTIIVCAITSIWCKYKIGGATGDTLGALCEINETAIAVVLTGAAHLALP